MNRRINKSQNKLQNNNRNLSKKLVSHRIHKHILKNNKHSKISQCLYQRDLILGTSSKIKSNNRTFHQLKQNKNNSQKNKPNRNQ